VATGNQGVACLIGGIVNRTSVRSLLVALVAGSLALAAPQSRRGELTDVDRGEPVPTNSVYNARSIGNAETRAALAAYYAFTGWGKNKGGTGNNGGGSGDGGSGGTGGSGSGGSGSGGSGSGTGSTTGLPLWTYDTGSYSGQIVGANPSVSSTATSIPVVIVPVVFTITQGTQTYTFDPTAEDSGCLGVGNSAVSVLMNSPLFQSTSFSFNGTSVGSTQYLDAFVRAEWWTYVGKTTSGYHLLLSPTVGTPLSISLEGSADGTGAAKVSTLPNFCDGPNSIFAFVSLTSLDPAIQQYISDNQIPSSEFVFFVTYNVSETDGAATSGNCCILGYHQQLGSGQTYGYAMIQGLVQGANYYIPQIPDVAAVAHEMAEWIHDPAVSNQTPAWGGVGQILAGCQGNFEVADPLYGTLMPPITSNGFTYRLPELAYFSWFFGAPSLAAGGGYSDNGTFRGPAKPCPPGGTN